MSVIAYRTFTAMLRGARFIYLVIYQVGGALSPLFTTRQKTIGLVGMIHEETHLSISCSCRSTFETIQT